MLNIRTFILALSLTPLLSMNWQLPSQAQSSPSVGNAGGMSGSPTPSSPSLGNGGSMSGSPSVGQGGSLSGSPSVGQGGSLSGSPLLTRLIRSGDIIISKGANGVINITASNAAIQAIRNKLNIFLLRLKALNNSNGISKSVVASLASGGADAETAATEIESILTSAGVDPELTRKLTTALSAIFIPRTASITPTSPSAQLPQDQLVASNKSLKTSLIVAQAEDIQPDVDVDINQLNNAINAYNQIVEESSPVTLQVLSQNENFVGIGKVIKELRAAID